MSDIICVTDRKTCCEDFLTRIERIAELSPKAIVLRAKELTSDEYTSLAEKVVKICERYGTDCILHNFTDTAVSLGCRKIHLPLHMLTVLDEDIRKSFGTIGASCHSTDDAITAAESGASYITAGHIFPTDCKKGLPPRGLGFLGEICRSVELPVYAIGGISAENIDDVRKAGAAGACIMSGLMSCPREKIRDILDM